MDSYTEDIGHDFAMRRDAIFATVKSHSLEEFEGKIDALVAEIVEKLNGHPEFQLEMKRRGAESNVHAAILLTNDNDLIETNYRRLQALGFTDHYQHLTYALIVARAFIGNDAMKRAAAVLDQTIKSVGTNHDSDTQPLFEEAEKLFQNCT